MEDRRTDDDGDEEEMDLLGGMIPVYVAMLAATIGGQIAGILLCTATGVATGSIAVPFACSTALEAAVGARLGAARSGGALTPRQAWRIGATYSVGLLAVTVPMLVWMDAAHKLGGAGSSWTAGRVALAAALFVVGTLARWGLMVLIGPRRR